MSDIKELNSKSYEKNSKYHRHTGPGVRHIQKSRSYKEDHSRKWRKRQKKEEQKSNKKHLKIQMNHSNFSAEDKFAKKKSFNF